MTLVGPLMLGVAGVAVGGLGWGALEARAFTTRRVRVPILPEGAAPTRILHISDIHLVPNQRAKLRWLETLARLEPDLVVNTGDNLGHPGAVAPLLEALAPLLRLPGAFVHGSNDYFGPVPKNPFTYFGGPTSLGPAPSELPWAALTEAFVDAGWRDVRNGRATIELTSLEVDLVGLDDPHIDRDHMPPPPQRIRGAGQLRIGVVHAPYARALEALRNDGAQLVLAGHTHGGQVRVPGFGALVTNCDIDRRRARGLSGWPGDRPDFADGAGSMWLHVSAGVGTSPYARVRFACRPEATLLELVAVGT
jgi:predicted MPP superfamily phosphohydrolase